MRDTLEVIVAGMRLTASWWCGGLREGRLSMSFNGIGPLSLYTRGNEMMTRDSDHRPVRIIIRETGEDSAHKPVIWDGKAWFEMSFGVSPSRKRRQLDFTAHMVSERRLPRRVAEVVNRSGLCDAGKSSTARPANHVKAPL